MAIEDTMTQESFNAAMGEDPTSSPTGEGAAPESSTETAPEKTSEPTSPETTGEGTPSPVPPTDKPGHDNMVPQPRFNEVYGERNELRVKYAETQKNLEAMQAELERLKQAPGPSDKKEEPGEGEHDYNDPLESRFSRQEKEIAELKKQLGEYDNYITRQQSAECEQYLEQTYGEMKKQYPSMNRDVVEFRLLRRLQNGEQINEKDLADESLRSHNEELSRDRQTIKNYLEGKVKINHATKTEPSGGPATAAPAKQPGSWDDVHDDKSFDMELLDAVSGAGI